MNEEMASLEANQTWVLEDLPVHASAIPVMWIYKLKTDAAGQVERYKARLVAKGFKQRDGIDFDDVFAPVSKYATLRALLAIAAEQDLKVRQLDIKTAFLNGELDEDLSVAASGLRDRVSAHSVPPAQGAVWHAKRRGSGTFA
jgi:hypothetical protein